MAALAVVVDDLCLEMGAVMTQREANSWARSLVAGLVRDYGDDWIEDYADDVPEADQKRCRVALDNLAAWLRPKDRT